MAGRPELLPTFATAAHRHAHAWLPACGLRTALGLRTGQLIKSEESEWSVLDLMQTSREIGAPGDQSKTRSGGLAAARSKPPPRGGKSGPWRGSVQTAKHTHARTHRDRQTDRQSCNREGHKSPSEQQVADAPSTSTARTATATATMQHDKQQPAEQPSTHSIPQPPPPPPPMELSYRQRVVRGPYSADWERVKAGLISSGDWAPPTFSEMNSDVATLDGKRIFVEGMGEAVVASHTRRVMSPNGSIVCLPNGQFFELKLKRKKNRGVRWLVRTESSGQDEALRLFAEVEALRSEYSRLCCSSYRRLYFGPLTYGSVPNNLIQARDFLRDKIHMMRLVKQRQGQIVPFVAGWSYGTSLAASAAASGAGLVSGCLVPMMPLVGGTVALCAQDNVRAKYAIEQAKRGPNLETTVVHASCPTTELDAPLVAHAAAA